MGHGSAAVFARGVPVCINMISYNRLCVYIRQCAMKGSSYNAGMVPHGTCLCVFVYLFDCLCVCVCVCLCVCVFSLLAAMSPLGTSVCPGWPWALWAPCLGSNPHTHAHTHANTNTNRNTNATTNLTTSWHCIYIIEDRGPRPLAGSRTYYRTMRSITQMRLARFGTCFRIRNGGKALLS
jgi:hypothetical protein